MLNFVTGETAVIVPEKKIVTIRYTNWRGETSDRTVIPQSLYFGSNEWHPEPTWLMDAIDLAKNELRSFAMTGITSCTQAKPQ
jgi:predicted DNA-binding transcriptional regulator YafY